MYMEHQHCANLVPVAFHFHDADADVRPRPAIPLELRQIRSTLPCGTPIISVAIHATHRDFTYVLRAMPGFEGGGRDAEGCFRTRSISEAYTPKVHNSESNKMEAVWPPLAPTIRVINGREYDGSQFPETALTRRMERAWAKVEPLMRNLCNLLQARAVKGAKGRRKADTVSCTVLVERIKAILADV